MYIPRTLQEISIEDIVRMQRDGIEITFDKLTGLKLETEKAGGAENNEIVNEEQKANVQANEEELEQEEGEEEGEEELDEIEISKPGTVCLDGMTKEEKKAHKKAVKAANALKRQNKEPKADKKKREKKYLRDK